MHGLANFKKRRISNMFADWWYSDYGYLCFRNSR